MRQVRGTVYDRSARIFDNVTGRFHCWATDYEEFESGPGNYTVALIELESGQIVKSLPEYVVFVSDCLPKEER